VIFHETSVLFLGTGSGKRLSQGIFLGNFVNFATPRASAGYSCRKIPDPAPRDYDFANSIYLRRVPLLLPLSPKRRNRTKIRNFDKIFIFSKKMCFKKKIWKVKKKITFYDPKKKILNKSDQKSKKNVKIQKK